MLDFKTPTVEDKKWADEYLKNVKSYNCEYTYGCIYVWRAYYRTEIARFNDFLICRWGKAPKYSYSMPLGKGDYKLAIDAIIEDAKSNADGVRIYGITEPYMDILNELYPDKFNFEFVEDGFDYIYDIQKMATLSGKKYHGKRNHITNFKKNNPNWSFEILDEDNINECIELHSKWISEHTDDVDFSFEFEAVLSGFENYKELGFVGGVLKVDGKAIAYTFGEPLNDDVFVSHFEKAPADIQGAYPIINQEFTKNCLMNYKYVNREEDLGIEGLRKAKQSYNPEILLKKGIAIYNG